MYSRYKWNQKIISHPYCKILRYLLMHYYFFIIVSCCQCNSFSFFNLYLQLSIDSFSNFANLRWRRVGNFCRLIVLTIFVARINIIPSTIFLNSPFRKSARDYLIGMTEKCQLFINYPTSNLLILSISYYLVILIDLFRSICKCCYRHPMVKFLKKMKLLKRHGVLFILSLFLTREHLEWLLFQVFSLTYYFLFSFYLNFLYFFLSNAYS